MATGRRARIRAKAELRERAAAGDLELQLHQIEPEDFLRYRVLDLDARIGLHEEQFLALAALGVEQELEGAERAIARAARQPERMLEQAFALPRAQRRARRDLDHLLVAALQRAFAFAEVDAVAGAVAEDLYFEVAGRRQEALDVDIRIAERGLGLGSAALPGLGEFVGRRDDPHASAAAAGDRLDQHGCADGQAGEEFGGFV